MNSDQKTRQRAGLVSRKMARDLASGLFRLYLDLSAKAGLTKGFQGELIGVGRSRFTQLQRGEFEAMTVSSFLSLKAAVDRIEAALKKGTLPFKDDQSRREELLLSEWRHS